MRPRVCNALALAAILAVGLGGCTKPGVQAPVGQAAQLSEATSDISVACGYAEELAAFGGPHARGLEAFETMAARGAHKLAAVYARDQGDVYQGETVGQIAGGAVSLLGDCGLKTARSLLVRLLAPHRKAG